MFFGFFSQLIRDMPMDASVSWPIPGRPAAAWTGERDATSFGPTSPQLPYSGATGELLGSVRIDGEQAPISMPPRLGEHTQALLREAGWDDARIAALQNPQS